MTGPIQKEFDPVCSPMMAGNLLQQLYNVADTLIVGRFLGPDALAAVGSSYTLMTFLNFNFIRALHGQRSGFFAALWPTGLEGPERGHFPFVCSDCSGSCPF